MLLLPMGTKRVEGGSLLFAIITFEWAIIRTVIMVVVVAVMRGGSSLVINRVMDHQGATTTSIE